MSSDRLDYIKGFFDTLYTDEEFLNTFLDCIIDPKKNDGFKLLKEKGFAFQAGDFDLLERLRAPNKDLEIRLAGGAYRFHTNEPEFWALLVDSKAKAIYIDAKLVENQDIDDEGNVTFTHSGYHFKLRFEFPWILGEKQPDRLGFSGQIEKADGGSTQSILGHRIFPWGNAFDPNVPSNPDIPSSQTASEELMDEFSEFLEDVAGKAYAVNIDLIEARKPEGPSMGIPSEVVLLMANGPKGDELLTATNAFFSGAGLAFRAAETIGKTWDAAIGGALGATGSVLTTSVKSRFVDDDQRRMTNKILTHKVPNVDNMLQTKGQELVNNVAKSQLRNKDFIDQVRKQFRDNYYIPWAKNMMNSFLRSKYWVMRKFWRDGFLTCYQKALLVRFDENMPKASMDALFKHFMEQRWATDVAPGRLKQIAQDIKDKDDEYKKKIAEIDDQDHLSEEQKEEKRKEATEEFKKEKERLEKEQNDIDKDRRDIDTRKRNEEDKELLESIKHDAEEARQREIRRVKEEKDLR